VELIRDLLIFIAVMFALCIVLIVVVSMLPDDNPLKRILTALSYRIGATLAAGMIAVPVEPIPGLDVLYDIAIPIALIWTGSRSFGMRSGLPNGVSTLCEMSARSCSACALVKDDNGSLLDPCAEASGSRRGPLGHLSRFTAIRERGTL